ncbi:DUF6538 domain-containing protein [Paracidovorax anthurii]|uniref:DUF6538 domain-containing protein n=1 Tax=Paracidovorax anthurii TaxID=78229 RepID=UPI00336A6CF2
MRNTYQKNGTFYLRLLVPKALLPHVTKSKVVQSLNTKDRRQAYLREPLTTCAEHRCGCGRSDARPFESVMRPCWRAAARSSGPRSP